MPSIAATCCSFCLMNINICIINKWYYITKWNNLYIPNFSNMTVFLRGIFILTIMVTQYTTAALTYPWCCLLVIHTTYTIDILSELISCPRRVSHILHFTSYPPHSSRYPTIHNIPVDIPKVRIRQGIIFNNFYNEIIIWVIH